MDIRLHEAARTGNIDNLHRLLIENPLLLNTNPLFSVQNPLHIATLSGQVDFAKEIIRLRPEFAKEVTQDGFRPMDMAAANGHAEIVKELMKMDRELCRVEGRDGRTGLHYATMKGKVDVIKVMVLGCVECLDDVNVGKESVVHVGVKNNQFEAVKVLVGLVRDVKRDDVLNMKDEHGNTVLHLATWMKQRQVIELLLGDRTPTSNPLEVNAINHTGLTAMDLLHIFPSEAGDREIEEILRVFGAMKSKEITSSEPPPPSESDNPAMRYTAVTSERCQRAKSNDLIEYFKFKNGRDSPSEARGVLLIIAVLVATVTFQVGLSPPGGIWQDDFPDQTNSRCDNIITTGNKKHYAGISIMGSSSGITFSLFVLFNTVGFTVSLYMINILTSQFPLQFELQLCIIAMFFSYNTAMASIAPGDVKVYIILITSILSSLMPFFTKWLKVSLKVMVNRLPDKIRKVIISA